MFIFTSNMIRFTKIATLLFLLSVCSLAGQESQNKYASSSVLATGKWFKIGVTGDGIYRIEYSVLKKTGLENPSNPRIYGNNAGQLSYYNDGSEPDDLKEVAIFISKGTDGIFNEGDYLLFFAKGTHRWTYDSIAGNFEFKRHNYSDTAFYFITSGSQQGKRVSPVNKPFLPVTSYSNSSDILYIHEIEKENLIKSGREWYQPVTFTRDTEINPGFKDIITTEPVKYYLRVLARSSVPSVFRLFCEGSLLTEINVPEVNLTSTTGTFAQIVTANGEALPVSSSPVYKIRFLNNGEPSALAWLDYLKIHARKLNNFDGNTTFYTDSKLALDGSVTEFSIKSSISSPAIWDVTDPYNARITEYTLSAGNLKFRSTCDSLRTFVVFIPENAQYPVLGPKLLDIQDLHSSEPVEMVIVTHPLFRSYAEELADFHNRTDGLVSFVVTPGEIYNEFSGGVPDIVAIRNFLRMKFIKQSGSLLPLKHVLLFGDGSFDNKSAPPGNTNFIPTWQSRNSNILISSFTSDDFFGLLEDGEGEETGTEDVGVGRLPVSDTIQARIILSKIKGYLDPANSGDWKNKICLLADDEDGNTHLSDAEGLAKIITDSVPWINIDKIYLDAYSQTTTSTGQFYPEAVKDINNVINSGALIFNYTGHGNETSLAHERVITSASIDQWKNETRLPLFITATCEFSRFDDIDINPVTKEITGKNSAGEKILFKKDGGAIALMSTTRLAYSAPNYLLNRNLFDAAFDRDKDGKALRLGEIIRIAKNRSGGGLNKRNFVLLGDPAVRLSYPWYGNIETDSINNNPVNVVDTLKALSVVTIKGHAEGRYKNLLADFNGEVEPVVYDKPAMIRTLGNDGGQKTVFSLQNNILFSGKTKASGGRFTFSFIVPRDIDYTYGKAKISYYASDQHIDLNGTFNNIVAGGFSNNISSDTAGPEIKLYLNDTLFRDGGLTDKNPGLYAVIEDQSGINIAGKALGHDLICWLDDDRKNYIVLNNYFENDPGTPIRGKVFYRFSGLEPGTHSVSIKAWDNYNNSAEKSIRFIVGNNDNIILRNLINYPNPFRDFTKISAQHNRPDGKLEVEVNIYSLNGQMIRTLNMTVQTTGYQLPPIEWDGCNSGGRNAGKGIYPYHMKVTDENGGTATISGRMIIL